MTKDIMNPPATIDLTQDTPLDGNGQDLLSLLPPELLDEVISYLYPAHFPDRILFSKQDDSPCSHPLDFLAATNHSLRSAVNAWAHSFLLQHAHITKYRPNTPSASSKAKSKSKIKTAPSPNLLRGRSGLLTWSEKHCVFCGKKSVRRAILANGLRCCDACDRKEWPGKITKTQAQRDYLLKESDLFIQMYPGGRTAAPGLLYGVYSCQGGHATMILEESLRRAARRKHGDGWEAEKDRRAAERQRKSVGDPNSDAWSELTWTKEDGLQLSPEIATIEADIEDAYWSGVSQWQCICRECHASFIELHGLDGESGFIHLAELGERAHIGRVPDWEESRFIRLMKAPWSGRIK
ncbi:hypothetical protein TI39_contig367g00020 [Zymoseptoria brevis]|uniref:Uncharacterized protein n=1 Tax=Zymoseptoria brevis TaxID=1047168 RepID=A0A0F4GPS1_9PEZI|nr:hypothetical protein TI39_contig367g00020 [Zymoseptoria brevis]